MRSALRHAIFGLAFAAFAISAGSAPAQDTSGMGTWKLNAEKSKFNPGPGPNNLTTKFEPSGNGVKWSSERIGADGKPVVSEYTAQYDGKDYPFKGNPGIDAVALRRINATTTERVNKKGGKLVSTEVREVAKDGKSYTTTIKGTSADGTVFDNRMVFDKQ
jgi:hypothetical protein